MPIIEKYRGVEIKYRPEDGYLCFEFEGKEREVKYLFEAKRIIDEPVWENCELYGYFVDGTLGDYIGKAKAVRVNKKSGKPDWLYKERFSLEYRHLNHPKHVFPRTGKNDLIYKSWEAQRDIVQNEERKLKIIISKLTPTTNKE